MRTGPRTARQTQADALDADIYRLASKLESVGYNDAALHVLRARYEVRQDMYRDDVADTI